MKRLSILAVICLPLLVGVSAVQDISSAPQRVLYGDAPQIDTLQQMSIVKDSVPTATIIPVQRGDVFVNDTVNIDTIKHHLTHAERRALRAKEFAERVDSLVESLTFCFRPTTMQAMPEGELRLIYADFYYLLVSPMVLEVHLPMERLLSQYINVLNFSKDDVAELKPEKYGTRWTLSFAAEYGGEEYHFDFIISTLTGEVLLTLQSPEYSMRYVGEILQGKEKGKN